MVQNQLETQASQLLEHCNYGLEQVEAEKLLLIAGRLFVQYSYFRQGIEVGDLLIGFCFLAEFKNYLGIDLKKLCILSTCFTLSFTSARSIIHHRACVRFLVVSTLGFFKILVN